MKFQPCIGTCCSIPRIACTAFDYTGSLVSPLGGSWELQSNLKGCNQTAMYRPCSSNQTVKHPSDCMRAGVWGSRLSVMCIVQQLLEAHVHILPGGVTKRWSTQSDVTSTHAVCADATFITDCTATAAVPTCQALNAVCLIGGIKHNCAPKLVICNLQQVVAHNSPCSSQQCLIEKTLNALHYLPRPGANTPCYRSHIWFRSSACR